MWHNCNEQDRPWQLESSCEVIWVRVEAASCLHLCAISLHATVCCVFWCHAVGFVMGMVFGILTRLFLRFMRYLGASHDQEVALTLGMAYLAYWITGQPCKGSGEAPYTSTHVFTTIPAAWRLFGPCALRCCLVSIFKQRGRP